MIVRYAAEAENDLERATFRYERSRPGLGSVFERAVRDTVDRMRDAPAAFPVVRQKGELRRALVARFPFALIYGVVGGVVFILAVAHTSRRPGYWARR